MSQDQKHLVTGLGGSCALSAIIKVEDRLNRLSLSLSGKYTLERLPGFYATPFLIMGCFVDQFSMLIEIIEERADIVTFNTKRTPLPLLRGDVQLQRLCHLQVK